MEGTQRISPLNFFSQDNSQHLPIFEDHLRICSSYLLTYLEDSSIFFKSSYRILDVASLHRL